MLQCLFSRRSGRTGLCGVLSLAALAAGLGGGASAQAALISTSSCDNSALSQPFASWGDRSSYKLVPGGDFEGALAGWTLSGGAHKVTGGATGSSSLLLPAGASVQSPFTCVNAAYPTLRFFAHNNSLLSDVLVQVVYPGPLGTQLAIPVGTVVLGGKWAPSLPMLTASAVPGALNGGTAQVALRFTALLGSSQIDDVYIDPRYQ
jgi:hypothetical protein